ncbi:MULTISPECIES: preprotein translocase subunit YajC [Rhizobium]|jgi:preprotein translocase subunit YajC|uniref:Sec translocon accessory complex subunit YajC n=6 Tax=Rhizobium TaxID=379 RepID=A0A1C3WP25_9HYPH|nr:MULTISPECIES: preprotein translocase subunit YajC [Rhizobium]NTJ64246.1 preprotein translocase subunit YajC [Rhizobium rhizogenes]ASW06476.1 preprotein translocase subunit YajC [Rhizobium sp. 11515TR]MBB3288943.1 preprotein translocase subunit YajC [Rhizobium sp. BK252]MBB3403685.1 preprotein translocase subunit YajC [Rhizobium sp. BK289]MBB3416130.1 preprotein translocase subunit YajC [Rhizobium sp. BK284]
MFITNAYAQSATDSAASAFGGSGFEMIILFVPLMVVWYFLLIRPQRAQAKKRDEILKNIRRGDQIVTSGIVGKVTKVIDEKELEVEIAEGVRIRVVRSAISEVRVKGEPVKADAA